MENNLRLDQALRVIFLGHFAHIYKLWITLVIEIRIVWVHFHWNALLFNQLLIVLKHRTRSLKGFKGGNMN